MPLPKPVLDSRTFEQLVAEQRGQIPRLATAWTDFNLSDPGITLLDLVAWLAEQDFYRFDRVSPEMLRAFLRLAGVTPLPPQTAAAVPLFTTAGAAPVALPDMTQVASANGGVTFETERALIVSPAILTQILAGDPLADVTAANAAAYDPAVDPILGTFPPFGAAPKPGATLVLGFDRALGNPGDEVSLYVWTTTSESDAEKRIAIVADWMEAVAIATEDCPGLVHAVPDWRRHYSVRTVWEYHAGPGEWHPLANVDDETRALTLSGFVRFTIPSDHTAGEPDPLFAIRCRMTRGHFECPTRLDRIAINAVAARHAETIDGDEIVGESRGHALERYLTKRAPIVAGSMALTLVHGVDTDTAWQEVAEWDEVGAHDRRYRMEYEAGALTTGDGLRGVVPPVDWELHLTYRVGGGIAGNVDAGTLTTIPASARNIARVTNWAIVSPALSVAQPFRAFGGAAAETLQHAQARAIDAQAEPQKAVTLDDFVHLALRTPGLPVGRAYAIANRHPSFSCAPALGSVTVVVVPDCRGPRPMPGSDMLRAVARYLERRRLVTTEVHVVAPHYVGVTVSATLHLKAGTDASAAAVASTARATLAAFFNPLTGGPDAGGWPAGRGVYRTEVMALLASLDHVARVTDLGLLVEGDSSPRCSNVEICPADLIASGPHQIAVRVGPASRALRRSVEHECP
jgi:predicted phage baseplate assembly protein